MIRVTVVHNADFSADALDGAPSEIVGDDDEPPSPTDNLSLLARADVADVARAVTRALGSDPGIRVRCVGVRRVSDVVRLVRESRPSVVFNLVESLGGRADFEPAVAAVLERLGVPYTGNDARALRTCLGKGACSRALVQAGVPVPQTWEVDGRLPANLLFPLIVKPAREDGSTGIHAGSVVHDRQAALGVVAGLRKLVNGPVLLQRYIDGREINVSMIGPAPMRVLPMSEIDFAKLPLELPKIVGYAAKWHEGSPEWGGTNVVDALLPRSVAGRIEHVARQAALALGLRDYARVDLRVDGAGIPWVIDVNPNCDLAPEAGFMRAVGRAGFTYPQFVRSLVDGAVRRRLSVPATSPSVQSGRTARHPHSRLAAG